MVVQPKRMKVDPHKYLEAIARRAKRLAGVHRVSTQVFGRPGEKASLRVTFKGADWDPDPELRESVDQLRREFSAAFPEWGISVQWVKHTPTLIRRVVRSFIGNDQVIQELDCGHRVNGERIRKKRVCQCCSLRDPAP